MHGVAFSVKVSALQARQSRAALEAKARSQLQVLKLQYPSCAPDVLKNLFALNDNDLERTRRVQSPHILSKCAVCVVQARSLKDLVAHRYLERERAVFLKVITFISTRGSDLQLLYRLCLHVQCIRFLAHKEQVYQYVQLLVNAAVMSPEMPWPRSLACLLPCTFVASGVPDREVTFSIAVGCINITIPIAGPGRGGPCGARCSDMRRNCTLRPGLPPPPLRGRSPHNAAGAVGGTPFLFAAFWGAGTTIRLSDMPNIENAERHALNRQSLPLQENQATIAYCRQRKEAAIRSAYEARRAHDEPAALQMQAEACFVSNPCLILCHYGIVVLNRGFESQSHQGILIILFLVLLT